MFKSIRYIIGYLLFFVLLLLKEIPYINLLVKDKLWLVGIIFFICFPILFMPFSILSKLKDVKYLIIAFIVISFLLFIFTTIQIAILSEILGIILYGLFWFLVIYKIFVYLKFSSEED